MDLVNYTLLHRAREIDKCKSVQPFHKQSAISVSFTETTDRPFPPGLSHPFLGMGPGPLELGKIASF